MYWMRGIFSCFSLKNVIECTKNAQKVKKKEVKNVEPIIVLLCILVLIILVTFLISCRRKRTVTKQTQPPPSQAFHRNPWSWKEWDLGSKGEYLAYRTLADVQGYRKFLFNCYIPKENGGFSEIDLIMLHGSGVYVFESKNRSGWIFGSEKDEFWTQRFRNGHKERFLNPIKQNNSHIKRLRRFLPGLGENAVHSVIVFGEHCELKKIRLIGYRHIVVKRDRLLNTIWPMLSRRVLTQAQIDTTYQHLYPQTQLSPQEKQAHRKRVADIQEGRVCPYCGSPLVLRTARKTGNQFMGCSGYPVCRYTAKLPPEHLEAPLM